MMLKAGPTVEEDRLTDNAFQPSICDAVMAFLVQLQGGSHGEVPAIVQDLSSGGPL